MKSSPDIQCKNRSRKQRGGFSQKEIFQQTGWETFGEALREANVPQDLVGHEDRWRYIIQTKRTPKSRKPQQSHTPFRPQKHQEAEGK